jgi:hypothetical protein
LSSSSVSVKVPVVELDARVPVVVDLIAHDLVVPAGPAGRPVIPMPISPGASKELPAMRLPDPPSARIPSVVMGEEAVQAEDAVAVGPSQVDKAGIEPVDGAVADGDVVVACAVVDPHRGDGREDLARDRVAFKPSVLEGGCAVSSGPDPAAWRARP